MISSGESGLDQLGSVSVAFIGVVLLSWTPVSRPGNDNRPGSGTRGGLSGLGVSQQHRGAPDTGAHKTRSTAAWSRTRACHSGPGRRDPDSRIAGRVMPPEVSAVRTRVERTMGTPFDSPSESRPKTRLAVDPETQLEGMNQLQRAAVPLTAPPP